MGELSTIIYPTTVACFCIYLIDLSFLFSQLLEFLISFLMSLVTGSSFNLCGLISGSLYTFYSFSFLIPCFSPYAQIEYMMSFQFFFIC